MNKRKEKLRGSAVIAAFMFAFLISVGISSILAYQNSAHKVNHRSFEGLKAFYIAESGLHIALHELNDNDAAFNSAFYPWVSSGSIHTYGPVNIFNGQLTITVNASDLTKINIKSEAKYQDVTKKIEINSIIDPLSNPPTIFPGSVATLSDISLMNSFLTDSYKSGVIDFEFYDDSIGGDYDLGMNLAKWIADGKTWMPGYRGDILSKGTTVALKSGSVIRGNLFYDNAGATISTGETSNGEVYHNDTHELASNNQSGTFKAVPELMDITVPPHLIMPAPSLGTLSSGNSFGPGRWNGATNLQNITFSGGFYMINGDLGIKNNQIWTISGNSDIYITGNLDVAGKIINYTTKVVGAVTTTDQVYKLRFFVDGGIVFAQGSEVNMHSNYIASSLQIFGTGLGVNPNDTIDLKNGTNFIGCIYAPRYTVAFNNGGDTCGAFACKLINPKNGARIHFDERLLGDPDGTEKRLYGISTWRQY